MMQVVADIWDYYGKGEKDFFSRIHLEVGRELSVTFRFLGLFERCFYLIDGGGNAEEAVHCLNRGLIGLKDYTEIFPCISRFCSKKVVQ